MGNVLLFIHLVFVVTWVGGGALLAPWSARARRSGQPHLVTFAAETTAWLIDRAIVWSLVIAIVSGMALAYVKNLVSPTPAWLMAKTVLVALAAIVVLAVQRPTGRALVAALRASSRKASAQVPHLARRQRLWGIVVGLLALAIIALAVFKP
jgi:uncharacterized membrane protein